MAESKNLLAWRKKQKRGAIMKPSTFEKIKEEASRKGYSNPSAVAGRAYWNTAEHKYENALGKTKGVKSAR